MNQKLEITKYVIEKLNLISPTERSFKSWVHALWQNPRTKDKGGLRLTEKGFDFLGKAGIKYHDIRLEEQEINVDNKFILWLDNYFDCPFYLTRKKIYIFNDKMAIQMVLFSGDLQKFYQAHQKFAEKITA